MAPGRHRAVAGPGLEAQLREAFAAILSTMDSDVALRHSSINLTREYYLDKKQPAFLSITKLLETEIKPAGATAQANA
ncbi:MAG: hypothetical protein ACYDH9_02855 [Limisphaerales bacterium]